MTKWALVGVALVAVVVAGSAVIVPKLVAAQTGAAPVAGLRAVADFDGIADERERSIAIFEETGKVLQHPRCLNCHPAGDRPFQRITMEPHQPPVYRGPANFGLTGMECNACHGAANVKLVAQAEGLESVPGNPEWALAPIEMAWVGRSLSEICEQMKDPARNGGRSMADLVEHMAHNSLVGWGWEPGAGREPVPGTQDEFGALYQAWSDTGAHCPSG